jgi:hypothetical protein
MILVDTSVIADILTKDPDWCGGKAEGRMQNAEGPAKPHLREGRRKNAECRRAGKATRRYIKARGVRHTCDPPARGRPGDWEVVRRISVGVP